MDIQMHKVWVQNIIPNIMHIRGLARVKKNNR